MMRNRFAGVFGVVAVAAVVTTAFVHAQTQDGTGAPPPRHERRGPGGPGGPGGPEGFFGPGGPGGPGGFGRGGFGGPLGLLRQLELTDEQRTQVRQLMDSHRDELRAVGEKLMAAHRAQNDAVTAAQFDEQAIRTKAADVAAIEADAAVLHAKLHSEVFALLTPEQQAKAAELKAQRETRVQQLKERVRERVQPRRPRPTAPVQ
jgi:periplasmic protein CpxP/Spy